MLRIELSLVRGWPYDFRYGLQLFLRPSHLCQYVLAKKSDGAAMRFLG
jgi:hypothetical protein